jgi:plasmid stabilization system protein ParE
MQIHFQPEAEAELAEARLWYAQQQEGLDDALMQRVEEALLQIIETPYAYQVVYRELRRAVLHQFPFAIFYRPSDDEIRVFAVYHSSRDPRKLRSRMFRER